MARKPSGSAPDTQTVEPPPAPPLSLTAASTLESQIFTHMATVNDALVAAQHAVSMAVNRTAASIQQRMEATQNALLAGARPPMAMPPSAPPPPPAYSLGAGVFPSPSDILPPQVPSQPAMEAADNAIADAHQAVTAAVATAQKTVSDSMAAADQAVTRAVSPPTSDATPRTQDAPAARTKSTADQAKATRAGRAASDPPPSES